MRERDREKGVRKREVRSELMSLVLKNALVK